MSDNIISSKVEEKDRPLTVRFPTEHWVKIEELMGWYRVSTYSDFLRLLIGDAHDMASGKGVSAVSPLAPSVIQARKGEE